MNHLNEGHLVLTRKDTETIIVDGPCIIEIIRTDPGRAKVGIRADRKVRIRRGELDRQDERSIRLHRPMQPAPLQRRAA